MNLTFERRMKAKSIARWMKKYTRFERKRRHQSLALARFYRFKQYLGWRP